MGRKSKLDNLIINKAEEILINIENEINKENIFINNQRDWYEIGKSILEEEFYSNYNEELLQKYLEQNNENFINNNETYKNLYDTLIFEEFEKLLFNYLKLKFNFDKEEIITQTSSYENLLKRLDEVLKSDDIEKLMVKNVYGYLDIQSIYFTKENLESSLEINNIRKTKKALDLKNYIYIKLIDGELIKSFKNKKGYNIHTKGSINCFVNIDNGQAFADSNSINELNDDSWERKDIINKDKIIDLNELDLEKYKVKKYIPSYSSEIDYINQKYIYLELNLQDMYVYLPSNKIESLSFANVVDKDVLFNVYKYYQNGGVNVDKFQLNEIGNISVIYNENFIKDNKKIAVKGFNEFLYLENFPEKKLFKSVNGTLTVSQNDKEYNSLYDIQELQDVEKNFIKLILLEKKPNTKQDIIRIPLILKKDEKFDKILKEVQKNFFVLNSEELFITENIVSQFNDINSLSSESIMHYYKTIISNHPEEILKEIEELNKTTRKNLEINSSIEKTFISNRNN